MIKKATAAILLLTLIVIFIYNVTDNGTENEMQQMVNNQASANNLKAGQAAPDLSLESLEAKQINLSDFKGKKVLLNFWATWCGPCKEEIPALEQLKQEYGNEVEILAVNATATELDGIEKVKSFKEQANVSFRILLDKESKAVDTYRVLNIPTSYFIGSDGNIKQTVTGPMTYEFMENTLKSFD
ncbi:TlpA family protein disulfide reductase [Sediminibacillus halophilus]|uniref:Peroxiredoxin n=1 Tax=Sediminibacillus halophilus TaxID=482461 RepID=A0A1G9MBI8_9BACI|nr:redoxin domain-containing protein [Sediminibacillus halophilus]SDL71025.1 Peroxiredoxin [Sediminibacillus halophilus]